MTWSATIVRELYERNTNIEKHNAMQFCNYVVTRVILVPCSGTDKTGQCWSMVHTDFPNINVRPF